MSKFDDTLHTEVCSEDGSYTAYSQEYNEHYHSTKDGALKESYKKHVLPAFSQTQGLEEVRILDICYGLGFNALCTILHFRRHAPDTKLKIYSPELDASLVRSLKNFSYPSEFESLRPIINAISEDGVYEDERLYMEVFLGDAREYVRRFKDTFDVVYQDAFSPNANPALWTREYFSDVANAMNSNAVLTTYSIALATRLALHENGFKIYLNEGEDFRDATIAAFRELEGFKKVDMAHKIACNPEARSLRDL
jgi:tRNA U34 5-methylaminomethyl-2-thiouridine-forming methyltransferase MnmC